MEKKGFTAIEILSVLAIVGILVLLVMPRYTMYVHHAKETEIRAEIKIYENMVDLMLIDNELDFDKLNELTLNDSTIEKLVTMKDIYNKKGIMNSNNAEGPFYEIPKDLKFNTSSILSYDYNLEGTFIMNKKKTVYYVEQDVEELKKMAEPEIPEELKEIEGNGNSLIKVNVDDFSGISSGNTKASDSLTKAIELSSAGDGLYIEEGTFNPESNDVFWVSPYKKYSAMILRKSLTLVGSGEKTVLEITDSNSIQPKDGAFFALTFNAPNITLKNMTIHVKQDSIKSLNTVFNIWGVWDGSTSKNLTLENVNVIIDSPVDYLFYMNDYNIKVKNMKVKSNGNIKKSMIYRNYGDLEISDSTFDFPLQTSADVKYINSKYVPN